MTWADEAACRGVDRSLFYVNNPAWTTRMVCRCCPVSGECLRQAMADEWGSSIDVRFGLRAGLGPKARRELERLHG